MTQLAPGLVGRMAWRVEERHSAEAWGSGAVPVFATPSLVGLVEAAAMEALAGRLGAGETSVGTRIEISHVAATPLGDEVRAEATLTGVDGRRLAFAVAAFDSQGKIGEGRHERIVVSRERFLERLRARAGA